MKILTVTDFLYRPATAALAKRLAPTPLSPNHVTLFRLGLAGVILWQFHRGDPRALATGGVLLLCYEFLDRLDGDLARAKGRLTALGAWLELVTEHPVITAPVLVGFALTASLWRADPWVGYWVTQLALTYGVMTLHLFLNVEKMAGLRALAAPQAGAPAGAGLLRRAPSWLINLQGEVLALCTIFSEALSARLGAPVVWIYMLGYAVLYNLCWMGLMALQYRAIRAGRLVRSPDAGGAP